MSANDLLFWMSARRQGSWQQFRSAVEELHLDESDTLGGEEDDEPDQFALPLYQTLRLNFQRVGHAEFFAGAGEADWRVTPPTLAVTQDPHGALGIVVGARSRTLLEGMHAAAGPVNVQILPYASYPDQILMTATGISSLEAVAERAGLFLQADVSATLLLSVPAIDNPCVRHHTALPFGTGWRIERFLPRDLAWRSGTLEEAADTSGGLFRFSLRHQRHVLFCNRGAAFRIPGQVGKFLVLRRSRRQVLSYDRKRRLLKVPASCRPPFLIERALILCSGSPPLYDGGARRGILQYSAVPESIASIAAALLRQELR